MKEEAPSICLGELVNISGRFIYLIGEKVR